MTKSDELLWQLFCLALVILFMFRLGSAALEMVTGAAL